MSFSAAATTTVDASAQEVLEFVLDLESYMEADHKIKKVTNVEGPDMNGDGSATLWARLRGMPTVPDKQDFHLDKWSRLTFTGASRQPGRLVVNFLGAFDCQAVGDKTEVTHSYEFTFTRPFRFIERFLDPWLQEEVEAEVERLAVIFGR